MTWCVACHPDCKACHHDQALVGDAYLTQEGDELLCPTHVMLARQRARRDEEKHGGAAGQVD